MKTMDLQDIKSRIFKDEKGNNVYMYVSVEEMNWLVKHAEKVEQLEKRLKELAQSNYCIVCGDDATEVRQGRFYCHECCN